MDRADEAKLKVLDPQLAAGDIIIPDGTLRDHVRYVKDEANKRGVSSIIYLKDFARGETKTITTELDRFYIQRLCLGVIAIVLVVFNKLLWLQCKSVMVVE